MTWLEELMGKWLQEVDGEVVGRVMVQWLEDLRVKNFTIRL